ncbi:hypothetical protein AOQ88_00750 [Candidatus Riesia sp. GBBU]|nr:hypothetical protein AOQ88_00750 [Candidatus Riesia sp. GBBU]
MNSNSIGIFFGSDTNNTKNVAKIIQKCLLKEKITSELYDIAFSKKQDIEKFKNLIFGTPTWYYGDIQCDWNDFLPILKKVDFSNKNVALFGCGDQEDYSEYFCDAIGKIANLIKLRGAKIFGKWSTNGYKFESSKALINRNYFIGLTIDEDRQKKLTNSRITRWVKQIKEEINNF